MAKRGRQCGQAQATQCGAVAGSGIQESEIKELASNNEAINYVGHLTYDKIDTYLNQSHFTIIPSKIDNLPTVGLESLMNQTPLLISNNTGLTRYLVDEKDCFKFDATIDSMVSLFEKVENKFDCLVVITALFSLKFSLAFTIDSSDISVAKIFFTPFCETSKANIPQPVPISKTRAFFSMW